MGHAKQKMRKQHVLKMWISVLHFKTVFRSVKVENIPSMSSGGSKGGHERPAPPLPFLDQTEARTRAGKYFFVAGRLSFLRARITDPTSPPPYLKAWTYVATFVEVV